jgi:hypothetical protein
VRVGGWGVAVGGIGADDVGEIVDGGHIGWMGVERERRRCG